jgi:Protein of unknown function (DUF998)
LDSKPLDGQITITIPSAHDQPVVAVARHRCGAGWHRPPTEPISTYGTVGSYGFLFTAVTLGSAVAALALTLGLYLGMVLSARAYIGLLFLGLYGVSELLTGLFPMDVGAEATLNGIIHFVAGNLSFFGFPIAVILLSLAMGKDERWRSLRGTALAVSVAVVLTVILTIVGSNIGLFGVTQRLANVTALVWMLLVAIRLRSVGGTRREHRGEPKKFHERQ